MKYLLSIFYALITGNLYSQTLPTDTVPAIIHSKFEDSLIKFDSELRPLRQIAGAPEPFYTYFWEFGDGNYSFEKSPLHLYTDTGSFDVRMYATNNYDDGKPPPTRPKRIKGASNSALAANFEEAKGDFFKSGGSVELKSNRMPKPNEEMILVLGYRNKPEFAISNLSGTVAILYNDKEFSKDNFELTEVRTYHNETESTLNQYLASTSELTNTFETAYSMLRGPNASDIIPIKGSNIPLSNNVIKEKTDQFRKQQAWRFENIKPGKERFLFLSIKTTPDMIKDTNAVVKLSAMFIPDDPNAKLETFDLELQIVASHDPNKMILKNRRMNYRFVGKNRKLTYKVRFQNTGKGPAKKVDIGIDIAKALNISSIELVNSKPKVIGCDSAYTNQSCMETIPTADSVHFVFHNIYLPGLQQKGVSDADSTMGYVEFKIGFNKKPKKLPLSSGAAIIFDKNEPIYTNRSKGRFTPGLSPGIIIGYGPQIDHAGNNSPGSKSYTFGFSLAPFSPYRKYLQAEVYTSIYSTEERLIGTQFKDTVINRIEYTVGRNLKQLTKFMTITAVPLQLRYNLNNYIGVGAGSIFSLNINKETSKKLHTILTPLKTANNPGDVQETEINFDKVEDRFDNLRASLFADLQIGKVRVGPSLGVSYLYALQDAEQRMFMYVTWKL